MCRAGVVVVVVYFCLTVLTLCLAKTTSYCPLNSTNKTEFREPIILTNSSGKLEFYIPNIQDGKLIFNPQEKFIISCPNPRNFLITSNSNTTIGQCTNGHLKVAGKTCSFQELSCNKSIRGDVFIRNNTTCGYNNHGTPIDIGYYVDVRSQKRIEFLPLIQVCHNHKKGNTYYSEHIIHGRLMKHFSKSRFRPGFSTQGLNTSAAVAYKQSYQKSSFSRQLGSSLQADNYINNKSFLSRGHLAPDADFLFAPWQFATYFYLNAVPQWQSVNGGNWHKVESMVRKLAGQLETDLRIITGTHGVLTFPGADHTDVEIFLLPNEALPVPKFIWKLVYSPKTKRAIVLISLNNPFVKDISEIDKICVDICKQYGWAQENWEKFDRGVVYCCEYETFTTVVQTVPEIDVIGVLEGPKKT